MVFKRGVQRLFLAVFALALCSAFALGATYINVSIFEVVYQETTFAENFTLTEWQKSCYSEGTINVENPSAITVFDINVGFMNTGGLSTNLTWLNTSKYGTQISGQPGEIIVIHVPELRPGNVSTFTYNISCMGMDPPVDIISNYTNADHGYNRKVLAGFNWTVLQSARNGNPAGLNITNINITISAQNVSWNDSEFPFSLETLHNFGDHANVHGNGTSNVEWWWAPNSGELSAGQQMNISYMVRAPFSVPFTATYLALSERIEYEVNYLLSNMSIHTINGSAELEEEFEKRISSPADNEDNHNVTWEITPRITVPYNITYDLHKVTLWVTENLDPTNKTHDTPWGLLEVNYTGSPLDEINISRGWGNASYLWYFNYTDGSSSLNPPPVVWMKPEWLIAHKYGQILNYTKTVSGNDIYLKYIYVIHGYWLEVQKNVTSIEEDQYQIYIYVENIGNGWTPQYEYVTVYDFVPNEFGVWDMTQGGCPSTICTNLSVGTVGEEFYGMSYRWNIPWKGGMNASLGPKSGPDAVGPGEYSWNITYKVNGTGPYRVTDLYIVGLDPLKVDGAFASPIITIIAGIQSRTSELIYISVIIFLVIVNVANLVMTNRIHRKIQERLPPAPPAHH